LHLQGHRPGRPATVAHCVSSGSVDAMVALDGRPARSAGSQMTTPRPRVHRPTNREAGATQHISLGTQLEPRLAMAPIAPVTAANREALPEPSPWYVRAHPRRFERPCQTASSRQASFGRAFWRGLSRKAISPPTLPKHSGWTRLTSPGSFTCSLRPSGYLTADLSHCVTDG
jgi:hypothetical protein